MGKLFQNSIKISLYAILVIIVWLIYSIIQFGNFYSPLYLKGLSNPYIYYKDNIASVLLRNGKEYTINDVDTRDWNAYEDKEMGFKFKYPNNLHYNIYPKSDTGYLIEFTDNNKIFNIEINYPNLKWDCSYYLGKNSLPRVRHNIESQLANNNIGELWYIRTRNNDVFKISSTNFNIEKRNIDSDNINFTSVIFIGESDKHLFVQISQYGKIYKYDQILKGIFSTFEYIR
ncbi:MAG: hypothetical protein ACD_46C00331G0005 [uncultured bacterium]|nr:MAG: hypothetical protein ACD_46C00331G0005 [uncultured bacterium]